MILTVTFFLYTDMPQLWNFHEFCHVSDSKWRQELSNLAYVLLSGQYELWGIDYAILSKYIIVVFERCYEQKKMVSLISNDQFEKKDLPLCVCHTNLIHTEWQDMYMVFMASASEVPPLWQFYGFYTNSIVETWGLSECVERPCFVQAELFTLAPQDIRVQISHLCSLYATLLQNTLPKNSATEYPSLIEVALQRAKKLWSLECRTAVPQTDYSVDTDGNRCIRLGYLLPLYILSKHKADLVLHIVNFEGVALLDVETAYTNARVLGRVESEWLKCSMIHYQYFTANQPLVFAKDDIGQHQQQGEAKDLNLNATQEENIDAKIDNKILCIEDRRIQFIKVWHYNTLYTISIQHVYETDGA